MNDKEFWELARQYDFSLKQAEFLVKFISRKPHTHTADQIEDLDEAVGDIVDELSEEEE